MSDAEPIPQDPAPPEAENTSTEMVLDYDGLSGVVATDDVTRLALAGNLKREPVAFEGRIKDPLRLREALSALHAVVASDFRYVPRTAPPTLPTHGCGGNPRA
jgi:hypothetical protein